MGCGRVGASLSDSLARIGHDVAVIDRDSTAFHRLSPEFPGERVLGMGFDRDVLLRSGIEEAGAYALFTEHHLDEFNAALFGPLIGRCADERRQE